MMKNFHLRFAPKLLLLVFVCFSSCGNLFVEQKFYTINGIELNSQISKYEGFELQSEINGLKIFSKKTEINELEGELLLITENGNINGIQFRSYKEFFGSIYAAPTIFQQFEKEFYYWLNDAASYYEIPNHLVDPYVEYEYLKGKFKHSASIVDSEFLGLKVGVHLKYTIIDISKNIDIQEKPKF